MYTTGEFVARQRVAARVAGTKYRAPQLSRRRRFNETDVHQPPGR
jgi:hypothetical protein